MKVDIAGLAIDLRFEEPSREAWARRRYAAFASRRRTDLAIAVCPGEWRPPAPGIRAHVRRNHTSVYGRGIIAEMFLRERWGVAWLSDRRFPMNALLRVLVAVKLLREGGLLLHASGVRVGRGAWVFPGRSGAGKSTLAKRFPLADVLSDEVVAVRLRGGRVEACGTPFPGELMGKGRPGWLPLHGFAFLRGPRRPRLSPLGPADALRRLLASTLGGWAVDSDVPRLWKAATALVSAARCADFGFSASEPRSSLLARLAVWQRRPSRGTARSPRSRAAR